MSRSRFMFAIAAALTFAGLSAVVTPAAAAPMIDQGVATAADSNQVKPEAVRMVCNSWGRCWYTPGYRVYRPYRHVYRPRYYRPRYYRPRYYRPRYYRHYRRW